MKPLDLIKRYDRIILYAAVAVLVYFLFAKPCNKPNAEISALKAENTLLKKEITNRNDTIKLILQDHLEDGKRWEGAKELMVIEKKEVDDKVKRQQNTIDRLASIVKSNTGKPIDSSFVLVSPAFKEACDSLPAEIDKLNKTIAEKDTAINQWAGIVAYEVQERDSTIDALQVQIVRVNEINERQNKITEQALLKARLRGRLLGGISVLGNENQFLSGAGVVLAYQSKGGKQYQISPKFVKVPGGTAEVFYEGAVLFTIFK